MEELRCPLCTSEGSLLHTHQGRLYYLCSGCASVCMHPSSMLTAGEEQRRYELHNNDVDDPRYQKFVSPLVNLAAETCSPEQTGLDFGCGPGPVAAKLLRDAGYDIQLFDPFFHNDKQALEKTYHYIICCEVIEHFHNPRASFSLLRSLLKPGGNLFCRTSLFTDTIDFPTWYYKNDETHTFFYSPESVHYIAREFNFSAVRILDDVMLHFSV